MVVFIVCSLNREEDYDFQSSGRAVFGSNIAALAKPYQKIMSKMPALCLSDSFHKFVPC